ncbi:MAG: PTS sugar transporter subunit IIA [Treponema sp.]|nr:PTS sugar transporter subunit IIA [Treponema sp.]
MIDDPILTIDEVAKYLRVSERTVYDWAQRGEIPSGKIGTVWRFKKSEIESWVNDRLSGNRYPARSQEIHPETIISMDRIIFLNHPLKNDALFTLADNLSKAPQIKNPQELKSEIIKREELMTTAIGLGIAIPHVRLSSVTDLVVSVGVSRVDIVDFTALDDEPVRLLIMIAAASNLHAYYLQTLSYFSSLLKNRELYTALLAAKTPGEIYSLLTGRK